MENMIIHMSHFYKDLRNMHTKPHFVLFATDCLKKKKNAKQKNCSVEYLGK